MARPPLPVGTFGTIHVCGDGPVEARCRFRDATGTIRHVRRTGRTKTQAVNRLKQDLADMVAEVKGAELDGTTRFRAAADRWLDELDRKVARGTLAANTPRLYRTVLSNHVLPTVGELRLRELTTPRLHGLLQAKRDEHSYETARVARAVLNGVCGYAVRHGALETNPVRETGRLERGPGKQVRALTLPERTDLLAKLDADERAVSQDIPDLCRLVLATGLRLGEVLALSGEDVELPVLHVGHHVVRVKGHGVQRVAGRKAGGGIVLRVPEWSMPVLRRRKLATGSGPLFRGLNDGWRDPNNTSPQLRRACDAAGYRWVTAHTLRKTVATLLDEADLPTTAIGDQLGNTPAVAERHYRAKRASNEAQAAALEGMWSS